MDRVPIKTKVDANQLIARGAVSPPYHPPSRQTLLERLFRDGTLLHECPIQQINGVTLIQTLVPSGIFLVALLVHIYINIYILSNGGTRERRR